jgi:hypothetical protein
MTGLASIASSYVIADFRRQSQKSSNLAAVHNSRIRGCWYVISGI